MLSVKAMSAGVTVQTDVVNFEAVQKARTAASARRRLRVDGAPSCARQKRTQSTSPVSKRQATSVRLSPEDEAMLDGARGAKSRSHFIIDAIRQQVMNMGGHHIPASLGIADRVYGATVHDDVVALANQLAALEYLLLQVLDRVPGDRDAEQLRLMLADSRHLLRVAAGHPAERGSLPS
jgi:hypothetical protein